MSSLQKILVVDDDAELRETVSILLEREGFTPIQAVDGQSGLGQALSLKPTLMLVDLRLPGLSGVEVITSILGKFSGARIIVLSSFGGTENVFRAFQAGARSYFLKDVKGRELVDAIRAVHAGQRPVPREIASCLAERMPCAELSPRELEILKLIASGVSNKDIASQLAISEGTVRVHASNVFSKLGCSDRAQAVAVAFHRGIITLD